MDPDTIRSVDPDAGGQKNHESKKKLRNFQFYVLKCWISVADPGCLSRIPDPDFYPSRIPDPGSRILDPKTATKEIGEKKLVVVPFYVATNFTKL